MRRISLNEILTCQSVRGRKDACFDRLDMILKVDGSSKQDRVGILNGKHDSSAVQLFGGLNTALLFHLADRSALNQPKPKRDAQQQQHTKSFFFLSQSVRKRERERERESVCEC